MGHSLVVDESPLSVVFVFRRLRLPSLICSVCLSVSLFFSVGILHQMSVVSTSVPVPADWTDDQKRLYLKIAKRRKSEHCLAYTVISLGALLYYQTTLASKEEAKEEESEKTNTSEVNEEEAAI